MPATAVTAAMTTAEVSPAAKASTADVSSGCWSVPEGRVMALAAVMVLPVMVVSKTWRVASAIPSIGVRGVSIAGIAVITITRFATSANSIAE